MTPFLQLASSISKWCHSHRLFVLRGGDRSKPHPAPPPPPLPVNAILRGGPRHGRKFNGVIGNITFPVIPDASVQFDDIFKMRPPTINQVTYFRTGEVLKNGRHVFRPDRPRKVFIALRIGSAPALWVETSYTLSLTHKLEQLLAEIQRSGKRPPLVLTGEFDEAMLRILRRLNATP